MDFRPSEEQTALCGLAREILAKEATPERLRAAERSPEWLDRELWARLADANLLGVAVPEAQGGIGLGFFELCALLTELGRAVAPLPAVPALAMGGLAIARFGSPAQRARWLPPLARGELVLSAALDRLIEGRTAIIIAHRLATVAHVDEIMVLEHGRVVEHGDRRELAASPDSLFAHLLETAKDGLIRDEVVL